MNVRGPIEPGRSTTRRAFLRDVARMGGSAAAFGLLATCTPAAAPAVPSPARVYRVGVISNRSSTEPGVADFWARLAELGYLEGQNLVKEERFVVGDAPGLGTAQQAGFAGPYAD